MNIKKFKKNLKNIYIISYYLKNKNLSEQEKNQIINNFLNRDDF
jgi:hypothetical protein